MTVHYLYPRPVPNVGALEDLNGGAFAGCTNDIQLSAYLVRSSFTWGMRGLASGIALGVLASAAGMYLWNRR